MQPVAERVRMTCGGHEVAADVHLADSARTPVVFFHGVLTSTALVPLLFEHPAAESWIAVSLPGHHPGRLASGTTAAAIDVDLFATLAEAAIERVVGDRRVIVAGWSLGGFAAVNLAIRHPRRVAAVASLAGFASGRRVTGSLGWLVWAAHGLVGARAVRAGLWAGSRLPAVHDAVVRSTAAAIPPSPEMLDRLRAEFALHDPAAIAAVLAAIAALDVSTRLHEVAAPAWIVAGGRDPVVPVAEARRLAAGIPGSRLTEYESAGHLFFTDWPRFRADFAAWRAGLPGAC